MKRVCILFCILLLFVACEHSENTTGSQKNVLSIQSETVAKRKDIKGKGEKKKVLHEENVWSDFVKSPTKENYEKCDKLLDKEVTDFHKKHPFECKPDATGECPDSVSYTMKYLFSSWKNGNYWRFLNLVAKGNQYAMSLAFKMYPLTQSSVTEDVNTAIARSIVVRPELFLALMKQYQPEYPTVDLKDEFLYAYYEEEYENMREKRSILIFTQMMKSLQKVKGKDLRNIKEACIKKLKKEIDLIRVSRKKRVGKSEK